MTQKRKRISIVSNDYKAVYGLSFGTIGEPFYETEENIKFLLLDGVRVNEHIKEKVVALTLENYNKDNSAADPIPPVAVKSLKLSIETPTLTEEETTTVTAVVEPSNADDKKVTFSSESELIAKVDELGTVTAVGEGTTNIVGRTTNGVEGKVEVTVNPKTE